MLDIFTVKKHLNMDNEVIDTVSANGGYKNTKLLSIEELRDQLRLQQEEFIQQQRDFLAKESMLTNSLNQHGVPAVANVATAASSSSYTGAYSSSSFAQGMIVGQLSVIVVIGIFIKFFVFQDASNVPTLKSSSDASGVLARKDKSQKEGSRKDSEDYDDENNLTRKINSILEKTYYDVDNHAPESLDWFNVLIAQTISQVRTEALISDNIFHSLNDFLATLQFPDYLDDVRITEIDIGDDYPILSNCRIKQSKDSAGRLEAKIDVDLSDTITLGIETRLLINQPRPRIAALPVQLSVSLVRFSGCLSVSLINPNDQEFLNLDKRVVSSKSTTFGNLQSKEDPVDEETSNGVNDFTESSSVPGSVTNTPNLKSSSTGANNESDPLEGQSNNNKKDPNSQQDKKPDTKNKESGTAIMFSFSPDYRLEFTIKSLIGSRAKLQDVPKISALIESKLKYWFLERCVEPRFQIVRIPSLWPRTKNTREAHKERENNV